MHNIIVRRLKVKITGVTNNQCCEESWKTADRLKTSGIQDTFYDKKTN